MKLGMAARKVSLWLQQLRGKGMPEVSTASVPDLSKEGNLNLTSSQVTTTKQIAAEILTLFLSFISLSYKLANAN